MPSSDRRTTLLQTLMQSARQSLPQLITWRPIILNDSPILPNKLWPSLSGQPFAVCNSLVGSIQCALYLLINEIEFAFLSSLQIFRVSRCSTRLNSFKLVFRSIDPSSVQIRSAVCVMQRAVCWQPARCWAVQHTARNAVDPKCRDH